MSQKIDFTMSYVLNTTIMHMLKNIETSVKKTFDRIPEFEGDQQKSNEIFLTLARLQGMKKHIESLKYNDTPIEETSNDQ